MTPGPWKDGGVFVMQEGGGKQYIAVVDSCETSHRARRKQSPMLAEAYANAKAIAALPQMIAALKQARDSFRDALDSGSYWIENIEKSDLPAVIAALEAAGVPHV